MKKSLRFDLYRYQILPRDRFQPQLFDSRSLNDILSNKNTIFVERLRGLTSITTPKAQIIKRIQFDEDSFLLLRVAVNRSLTRETKDFKEEEIDTWPSFLMALWNTPDKQVIAVQERKEAFQDTNSAVRAVMEAISSGLSTEGLRVYWEPFFVKDEFWGIVAKYEKQIKDVEFQFITPNMANIRGIISDDLKELSKNANAVTTTLKLTADPEASLNISRDDPQIDGLVTNASDGGGNISVKIIGHKRRLYTSESRLVKDIDEVHITGRTAADVVAVLKEMFNETLA